MSSRIMKLLVTNVLIFTMAISLSTVAFAGSYPVTYSGDFTDSWMDSSDSYEDGYKVILSYGYDTFLINEDIA